MGLSAITLADVTAHLASLISESGAGVVALRWGEQKRYADPDSQAQSESHDIPSPAGVVIATQDLGCSDDSIGGYVVRIRSTIAKIA